MIPETVRAQEGALPDAGGLLEPGWRGRAGRMLDTPAGRHFVHAVRRIASPREALLRRLVARAVLRRRTPLCRVDREQGYLLFDARDIAGAALVLRRCRERRDELQPRLARSLGPVGGPLRVSLDLFDDELLAREPQMVDFVLHDELLLPVVDYLSTVPYLGRLALSLSTAVAGRSVPEHFQRFHVDEDDTTHLKLYVCASEVGARDGPLCFLPARTSERVLGELAREGRPARRGVTWSEAEVWRHCDPSELVRLVGPPGTAALVDLSRCLHYGSRVAPGRERLVLVAVWLRLERLRDNPANLFASRARERTALRGLALATPSGRRRGLPPLDRLGSEPVEEPTPVSTVGCSR